MRYVPSGRDKEFISYRNGMKWSYIAFERSENISHEQSEYIALNSNFQIINYERMIVVKDLIDILDLSIEEIDSIGQIDATDEEGQQQLIQVTGSLKKIAKQSFERKTGARGLRSIMEGILTDVMYQIPSDDSIEECIITKETVEEGSEPTTIHKNGDKKKLDKAM